MTDDRFGEEQPDPGGEPLERPDRQPADVPWGLLAAMLLMVAIIILAGQNTQEVELNYLGWSVQAPLVVIVLSTAVVSMLLDELIGVVWRRRKLGRRREREELRRLRGREEP